MLWGDIVVVLFKRISVDKYCGPFALWWIINFWYETDFNDLKKLWKLLEFPVFQKLNPFSLKFLLSSFHFWSDSMSLKTKWISSLQICASCCEDPKWLYYTVHNALSWLIYWYVCKISFVSPFLCDIQYRTEELDLCIILCKHKFVFQFKFLLSLFFVR